MKKIKIAYWIITILFAAWMIFSSIGSVMMTPEAVTFMNGFLGYPKYMIFFIGMAKILGVIAIFIPGFPRVREWAYAGLFFDLTGATYSIIAAAGFEPIGFTIMMLTIGVLFTSYFLAHKLDKEKAKVAG